MLSGHILILCHPNCLLQQKESSATPLGKAFWFGFFLACACLMHHRLPDRDLTVWLYADNAKIILEQETSLCYVPF